MPRYTCARGHCWELAEDDALSSDASRLCPVCGAVPETVLHHAPTEHSLEEQPPVEDEDHTYTDEVHETHPLSELETTLFIPPRVSGYDVLGELGRGGMGVVYKARHLSLKRVVALKMLLGGSHAGPFELARFRAEAEAVARLQHPNIVQIYEVGDHEGLPFFSLEYINGKSLAYRMTAEFFSFRDAAALVEALARAIHFAHQQGIIHRDLKPGNVLLTRDGVPKLTDFGLAKRLDAKGMHTRTGAIMGTPSYMAPEQARGLTRKIGPHTDIYALGAILYELLTGRPPFKAETPMDTIFQVVADEPPKPSQLQPRVPRDLQTICLKCLQKEPSQRYPSAEALADDLRSFLQGEPIRARPLRLWERLVRSGRRWQRELVSMLIGAGVVLAVLGFTGVLLYLKNPALFHPPPAESTNPP